MPIWRKAVLSVEEAAQYGSLSPQLLRALIHLAQRGRAEFPHFYSGDTAKIPRQPFERWLASLGEAHARLDLKAARAALAAAERAAEAPRRGRPRKAAPAMSPF